MIGKHCTKCGAWKLLKDFNQDRSTLDEHTSQCKECRNAKHRQRYAENREKYAEKNRQKRQREGYSEKHAEYMRLYRQEHREEFNARQRKYAATAKYRERRSAWTRQKYANDPRFRAQVKATARRHRARKVNAEGSFSEEEWVALCDKFGWCCVACGALHEKNPLEADHVVPLSKGGTDWIENIQPLCRSCNGCKMTQTIDYR